MIQVSQVLNLLRLLGLRLSGRYAFRFDTCLAVEMFNTECTEETE